MSALTSSAEPTQPATGGGSGWEHGARGRFLSLASARLIAQIMGIVWFVVSARILNRTQFGLLATGMVFFAVFAGLGDLGTSRGIVRHVAANHSVLVVAFARASRLRIACGGAAGVVVVALLATARTRISLPVVALAAAIATLSGVTELGYAALRSVGRVATESLVLMVERGAFLALATVYVVDGGSAIGVLWIYLVTNTASAAIVSVVIASGSGSRSFDATPFLDRTGRFTAAEFALATLVPRISPTVLALVALPATVGGFAAAQRPVEAVALLALSTATPVMPIVRQRLAAGRFVGAERAASSVNSALLTLAAPFVAWLLVDPSGILRLLFGARPSSDEVVVRLMAVTTLTWIFRGIAELVLLAEDRSKAAFLIMGVGFSVNLAAAIILVTAHGVVGAASATLLAEFVMLVLVALSTPSLVSPGALRQLLAPAALGILTAATIAIVGHGVAASTAIFVMASVVGVLTATRVLRGLGGQR